MNKLNLLFALCMVAFTGGRGQNRPLHSPAEKISFARHLYCTGQYSLAIGELAPVAADDSVHYLLGQCYLSLDNITETLHALRLITNADMRSGLVRSCARQLLHSGKRQLLYKELFANSHQLTTAGMLPVQLSYQFLFEDTHPDITLLQDTPVAFRNFLLQQQVKSVRGQYNPLLAAGLSAVVPGLGKIYTKKYEEGAFSFLLTGLFTYLTVQNIRHQHTTRAWITGSSAILFYGGSIVGSYASAILTTQQEQQSIETETILFMKENNYFMPVETVVLPCK